MRTQRVRSEQGFRRGNGRPQISFCSYKGVRRTSWGQWIAEIHLPDLGFRRWLGTFRTPYQAAITYDRAVRRFYPNNIAMLNFPTHLNHNRNRVVAPNRQAGEVMALHHHAHVAATAHQLFALGSSSGNYEGMFLEPPKTYVTAGFNMENGTAENKNAGKMNKAVEKSGDKGISKDLNVNLAEIDESSMWVEAEASTSFQEAIHDPGFFLGFPW